MSSPDVSAHVRRLWRHRGTTLPTPRRGPRQQLDLDEILDAAIALADADGLTAVSTRAVAARFGKTAMALYPYVGTKEQLVALMQDQACALPPWSDPASGPADDVKGGLEAWALAFFDLHLAHPWLAELSWSRAAPGPNERDWLERLLGILDHWQVAAGSRSPVVTMLYATVRSCAETAAAHRRTSGSGAARWREEVEATYRLVPSLATRYPLAMSLPPVAADWRDAPRAGLVASVQLLSESICE